MPDTTYDKRISSAQLCRDHGWEVGAVLRPATFPLARFRITAIGQQEILAERIAGNRGEPFRYPCELLVDLRCDNWEQVKEQA